MEGINLPFHLRRNLALGILLRAVSLTTLCEFLCCEMKKVEDNLGQADPIRMSTLMLHSRPSLLSASWRDTGIQASGCHIFRI